METEVNCSTGQIRLATLSGVGTAGAPTYSEVLLHTGPFNKEIAGGATSKMTTMVNTQRRPREPPARSMLVLIPPNGI